MDPYEINSAIALIAGMVETIGCLEEIRKAEADPIAGLTAAAILETIEAHHHRGIA